MLYKHNSSPIYLPTLILLHSLELLLDMWFIQETVDQILGICAWIQSMDLFLSSSFYIHIAYQRMLITLSRPLSSLYSLFLCMVVLSFPITVVYILWGLPNRHVTPGSVPWLFRNKSFFGQMIEHIFNIDPTDSIEEGYQKV